jgi:glutamyl-tRNA synthetase
LHIGNLRTALVAWLFARSTGRRFVVRMEDLDRVTSSAEWEARQLADLAAVGIEWDGDVVRQSNRFDLHHGAIDHLTAAGLTYSCWCTRREIAEAATAPHGAVPTYPGTCRNLTERERAEREATGRPAALRLRTNGERYIFDDLIAGPFAGVVDDIVLRRNDGIPAYNLAVVVDDGAQGVDQVVRGDDLTASTPSQIHLASLLGIEPPNYAHVPLVLGPDGERLAKRHGAVTLDDLGWDGATARSHLAVSLDLAHRDEPVSVDQLLERFDRALLPRAPWTFVSSSESE